MDFWLDLMPQRTPWVNHVGFETIHPFADGNGRTGRMLMWWQEVQAGQTPTLFKAADRQRYYADLSSTRLEDV
jgi:Fic family protein